MVRENLDTYVHCMFSHVYIHNSLKYLCYDEESKQLKSVINIGVGSNFSQGGGAPVGER